MELRRALLLFAIVLGVAAIVTSVSSPSERDRAKEPEAPRVPAGSPPAGSRQPRSTRPVRVRFDSERRTRGRVVDAGRPATVTVSVGSPGEVRLEGLGLSSPAEPLTPAIFELLPTESGRHLVRFTRAGENEDRTVGVLEVETAR